MGEILVQVVPQYSDDLGDLGSQPRVAPELFRSRISEIGDSLADIANSLRAQLEQKLTKDAAGHGWSLGSVELKFSLDLETEVGVIISRAKASAGFEVTLGWKTSEGSA